VLQKARLHGGAQAEQTYKKMFLFMKCMFAKYGIQTVVRTAWPLAVQIGHNENRPNLLGNACALG
jgi:hypothetical protein